MKIRKIAVMGVLVGAMALGVGAVSAQRPGGDRPGERPQRPGRDMIVLQILAEQTGLEPRELMMQLRDGATLADLITANGGDVDAVVAEAVAQLTEQINTAVSDERLTQEQADQLLANLEANVTAIVNGEMPLSLGEGFGGREGRGEQRQALMDSITEATGLTAQELLAQLREGKTLAEILTENGADVTAFIDQVIAEAETHLDEAVAAGRLTEEEKAERLEMLRQQLEERINNPMPLPAANGSDI